MSNKTIWKSWITYINRLTMLVDVLNNSKIKDIPGMAVSWARWIRRIMHSHHRHWQGHPLQVEIPVPLCKWSSNEGVGNHTNEEQNNHRKVARLRLAGPIAKQKWPNLDGSYTVDSKASDRYTFLRYRNLIHLVYCFALCIPNLFHLTFHTFISGRIFNFTTIRFLQTKWDSKIFL